MTSSSEDQQTQSKGHTNHLSTGKCRHTTVYQRKKKSTSSIVSEQTDTEILLLCGFPSSGTDLLKNLVNAHISISIGGEFPLLPSLAQIYTSTVPSNLVGQAAADLHKIDIYNNLRDVEDPILLPKEDCSFAELYGELLTAQKVKWIGNKTPQNSEHVSSLNQLFPTAKFIFILRDVRDVVLSWHSKWGKDQLLTASKWNDRMVRGLRQLDNLGTDRYLLITFEELLRDTESVSRKICDFLDIEFQPSMLDYHLYVDQVFDGKRNYGQPILSNNSEKWRANMSPSKIKRVEEIAYEGMQYFGYQPSLATGSIPLRRGERISGRLRDVWSMLFVGNRALKKSHLSSRLRAVRLEVLKRLSTKSQQLRRGSLLVLVHAIYTLDNTIAQLLDTVLIV